MLVTKKKVKKRIMEIDEKILEVIKAGDDLKKQILLGSRNNAYWMALSAWGKLTDGK